MIINNPCWLLIRHRPHIYAYNDIKDHIHSDRGYNLWDSAPVFIEPGQIIGCQITEFGWIFNSWSLDFTLDRIKFTFNI